MEHKRRCTEYIQTVDFLTGDPPEPSPPRLFCLRISPHVLLKKTKKKFKDEATDEIEIGIKGFFFNEMALKRHETLEKLLP